jgi:hypothetical protein
MAASKPFMNTDRLKGCKNYREWCFDIKNILVIETVWSAIEGYPAEGTTPISIKKQKVEKARAIICLTLEPQVKSYVVQTTTAKEAWNTLERTFKDEGVNSWISILTDLCSMKLEDYKSMHEYVNTFMSTNLRLVSMGKKYTMSY